MSRARAAVFCAFALSAATALGAACKLTDGLTGGAPLGDGGGDAQPACDADLARSVVSCGACGHACEVGPNAFAACVDGGCALACAPGYGDCNGDASDGCETNVQNGVAARTNCGRCGHDCVGGQCGGGACQPYTLASGADAPVRIVSDPSGPYLYGVNAYGTVARVQRDGGPVQRVFFPNRELQDPPPQVAFLTGDLFVTSFGADAGAEAAASGAVWRVPLDGGRAQALVSGAQAPYAVAVGTTQQGASSFVYWSEGDPQAAAPTAAIKRCKLANCAGTEETVLAPTSGRVSSIFVEPTTASVSYYANSGASPDGADGTVVRCSGAPCAATVLGAGPGAPAGPFALLVAAGAVYWTTTSGAIVSCAIGGCSQLTVLDTGQLRPLFLAADAPNAPSPSIYWTSSDGTVRSVSRSGSAFGKTDTILFEDHTTAPFDIVVDQDAIYWTDTSNGPGDARVYRLAR